MIPSLDPARGQLPPGVHPSTWDEFKRRFGTTSHRESLLQGLQVAMTELKRAGCRRVYIDGSFVTGKVVPEDYDGCWEEAGVDWAALKSSAPALLDFSPGRKAQKAAYKGELFPANRFGGRSLSGAPRSFLEFFQFDRNDAPKGIVALDL